MTTFEVWTLIGGSGIALGIAKLIFHFGKIAKTMEAMQKNIETMASDLKEIKTEIKNVDSRLNHLEGAFFERGQWEARSYKISKSPIDNQG